jgi:hypothetical protein
MSLFETDEEIETVEEVDREKKYDTVVSSGQASLRALFTINGGATIAFMTFIGHLWDKGTPLVGRGHFVGALAFFLGGAFFSVLGYGSIFLTNCFSYKGWIKASDRMFYITVLFCGVGSVMCFVLASWQAVAAFESVTSVARMSAPTAPNISGNSKAASPSAKSTSSSGMTRSK